MSEEKCFEALQTATIETDGLISQVNALMEQTYELHDGNFSTPSVQKNILQFSELLLQKILKLDGIVSENEQIRAMRKEQVVRIQEVLSFLDSVKVAA